MKVTLREVAKQSGLSVTTVSRALNGHDDVAEETKQAVRHADIAIDRQWNVDEQGYTAENILQQDTYQQAIQAAAVAIAAEITRAASKSE